MCLIDAGAVEHDLALKRQGARPKREAMLKLSKEFVATCLVCGMLAQKPLSYNSDDHINKLVRAAFVGKGCM